MRDRITIKSVKSFPGHDTISGWSCAVFIDGNRLPGTLVDDGRGGQAYFHDVGVKTAGESETALQRIAVETAPERDRMPNKIAGCERTWTPAESPSYWLCMLDDLVNAVLREKDFKTRTTKEVWFQLEGEDEKTFRAFKRREKISNPKSHMDEHFIIDMIVKVSEREGKAIKSIKGIRHATKRKELSA